jgi:hypothetical protein
MSASLESRPKMSETSRRRFLQYGLAAGAGPSVAAKAGSAATTPTGASAKSAGRQRCHRSQSRCRFPVPGSSWPARRLRTVTASRSARSAAGCTRGFPGPRSGRTTTGPACTARRVRSGWPSPHRPGRRSPSATRTVFPRPIPPGYRSTPGSLRWGTRSG